MRKITLLLIMLWSAMLSAQQLPGDRYSISPNPSNGRMQVTLPAGHADVSLTVYNILGTMVFRKDVSTPDGTVQIDISTQPAGIYMVNIRDNGESTTRKVIVK